MTIIIDNNSGDVLTVEKTDKRLSVSDARAAMVSRKVAVSALLDPSNAPWPCDGLPNMAERVYAAWQMTPKERALTALMARDTPPANLTPQQRENWLDGLFQIGG